MRFTILILLLYFQVTHSQLKSNDFPKKAKVFCKGYFNGSEGIAFSKENKLFVTGDNYLWEISSEGKAKKVTALFSSLGLAPIGDSDILVADFGPKNAFKNQRNNDGIIWRVDPSTGIKKVFADGFGDPNFILPIENNAYLVSDDVTNEIFKIDRDNNVTLFTTAVNHPNGLAINSERNKLYVAQIFKSIRPIIFDNSIWQIDLENGKPVSEAKLVVKTGDNAANDGLLLDKKNRLYIAANKEGKIYRYDPDSKKLTLITENVYGVASMTFGMGSFGGDYLYFTTTYSNGKGGKIYRVKIKDN